MPITVYVPGALQQHTGGAATVELAGSPADVAAALAQLFAVHPGLRDRLLDERGELRRHVHLFVGSDAIRDRQGFATPLPENAELTILPAVSGG